jgi:hypothetical protein
MTNYNVKLTPDFINLTTEGGLDSSILNGKSYQRTFNMYEVDNLGNRKMINNVKDGNEFNSTTFEDSTATGSFEANLVFTADQILVAGTSNDQNGFVGNGAILLINSNQAKVLNSYGQPNLLFSATWQPESDYTDTNLIIFTPEDDTFIDIAFLVPAYGVNPYCDSNSVWNMPVTVTGFIEGGGLGFAQNSQPVYKLFKQAQGHQEISFDNKSPEEKVELIKNIFRNMPEDHPLKANIKKKQNEV